MGQRTNHFREQSLMKISYFKSPEVWKMYIKGKYRIAISPEVWKIYIEGITGSDLRTSLAFCFMNSSITQTETQFV